ncbi:MAG: hypothetical protein JO345_35055 [Streptosporangiaceae bacterium]|nr:hypothetical protein [Streptosporangiaceae bacterium]
MERGESGAGRDAYGQARRRGNPRSRPGTSDYDRDGDGGRGYFGDGRQPRDENFNAFRPPRRGEQDGADGDYSQLPRRPPEPPPRPSRFRPGRGRLRQPGARQPNRQSANGGPGSGVLGDSSLLNDRPGNSELRNGGYPRDRFANGTPPSGASPDGRRPNGGPPGGAPMGGRRPNGRPVNGGPGYDGPPDEMAANGGPWTGWSPGAGDGRRADGRPPGFGPRYPAGGSRNQPSAGRVPPAPGRQYLASNGRRVPPRADRLFRTPTPPNAYQPPPGRGAPGSGAPGTGMPQTGVPGPGMPGRGGPGADMPGPGGPGHFSTAAGGPGQFGTAAGYPPGGARPGAGHRRSSAPPPRPRYGEQTPAEEQHEPAVNGQVIRQRDNALPEPDQISASQPIAAIAPDGLDSFARDLRALRAKAELDLPDMAEKSHYTMKTLASAAGGLRLPTLPVAVAYVRACGGDVAEWEDRWHKLAEKITAEAVKKQGDSEEPPEPAEASEAQSAPGLSQPPEPQQPGQPTGHDEVYVITSAKPRSADPQGNEHLRSW